VIDFIKIDPSNILHKFGQMAHDKINRCREKIAERFNVKDSEIYFTSGATESNNIIIQGIIRHHLEKLPNNKFSIITSSFEHPSVNNIFKHYEKYPNIETLYVEPCLDKNDPYFGCIKVEDIEKTIGRAKNKIILLSIMHANNETGAIQDIKNIGKLAKNNNIFFHSDITQSAGKYKIDAYDNNLDGFSFSAHKFHGPKGVGCLFIKKLYNDTINLCYGGEQENHVRPGTENLSNITGMKKALEKVHENRVYKNYKMQELKHLIVNKLEKNLDVEILGPTDDNRCLPNTILILIKNIGKCNKKLVEDLNKKNIFVSVGSACQTESNKESHVLNSINVPKDMRKKVIRISLSDYNTMDECKYLINNLIKLINNKLIN
jgi:cysteine desulfurase